MEITARSLSFKNSPANPKAGARNKMKSEQSEIIYDLIKELASELDLHYEDEDFFALKDTISVMQAGVALLSEAGREPPQVYNHVLAKFRRQQN